MSEIVEIDGTEYIHGSKGYVHALEQENCELQEQNELLLTYKEELEDLKQWIKLANIEMTTTQKETVNKKFNIWQLNKE